MADSIGRLQVDLEARIAKFESDMGRAARVLQRDMVNAQKAAERASTQMRAQMERNMERIESASKRATGAIVAFFGVHQFTNMARGLASVADGYSNIQAKVRLAAGENANLARSFEQVYGVAQRTYGSLDGTAALVQRGATALRNFGQNADVAFNNSVALAEMFNKALVVSGAKTSEAAAAQQQFSQALASGRFQGDEFRSVLENNSRFAQLLADSLGVNIAQLRELSSAGKLTTTDMLALLGRTKELDAEFERMPLTISRARTYLDNAFTKYIGEADQATGASRAFAQALATLANNLGPVLGAMSQLAVVTAAAMSARIINGVIEYGKATLARAAADETAAVAATHRAQADAAANAVSLARARSEVLNTEASAAAATADRARIQGVLAMALAQEAVIRANGLRATSEIQLARLSAQLTQIELARIAATEALGVAREREIAANVALATSNKALAAAETAAGVAGATAATKITTGMRLAQAATAAMTLAGRALAGALALVGGPLGAVLIGVGLLATAMYNASQKAKELKQSGLDAIKAMQGAIASGSALQAQQAGEATLAEIAKQEEQLAALRAKGPQGTASDVFNLQSIANPQLALEISQQEAVLARLRGQFEQNTQAMLKFADTARTAAESTTTNTVALSDFQKAQLNAQNAMLANRLELEEGIRARLLFEAMQAEGVTSVEKLSEATRNGVESLVAEHAALQAAQDALKGHNAEMKAGAKDALRDASAREQNSLQIRQMAADLEGPLQGAIEENRQELSRWRKAMEAGELSVADMTRVEKILAKQLQLTTAEIVNQREEQDKQRRESATQGLLDFANSQREEINRLEALRDGRAELVHVMRGEAEIYELTKGLKEGEILLMQEEIEAIRAKARELEKLNSIMRAGDLISGILNGTTDAIVNGGDPGSAFLGGLADTLPDLLKEMDKLGQLSGTWGENLAAIGTEILPALGNMLGTIAGGGGSGAALGSSLLGTIGGMIGGPIGAFIGSVVGGLVGGLFDGSPEVNVAGANAPLGKSTAQTRNTAFGLVKVREEGMEGISSVHVADAIEEFDFAIASMMSNAQVAAVTAALSTWRIALEGGDATIEGVLEQRFGAILTTFGSEISTFVNGFAVTLEDRAQALGDVLSLQALESSGDLLSGTLTQTLALIDEFGRAGETIAEIYNRLAQTASAYAQVVAVAQEELLLDGLSENMQRAVEIRREEIGRIDALQRQAVALGLVAAREEDLAVVREAAAAKMATLMADIQFEIADLAAELYGSPLEAINAQIEALGGAADSAGRSVADFLQSLGMSADLSPFNDRIRRGMAEDALRTAAASGDVDGFISAAEQFLQISRLLNATGSDYRADFDLVNQLGGAFGTGTGDNTATLEQLYAQQAVLQAQQEAARRLDLATQLATNVADLASLQGVSAIDLLGTLGLDPTRLAADLGLSGVDQLASYLSAQSADADFLAQTLYDLPERIARELFDLLYAQVTGPVVVPDTGTGTVPGSGGTDPGTTPGGYGPGGPSLPIDEGVYDPVVETDNLYYRGAPPPAPSESPLAAQVAALAAQQAMTNQLLLQIVGHTGTTAGGIHDIKQQGRGMGLAVEATKTRSTRTETVR